MKMNDLAERRLSYVPHIDKAPWFASLDGGGR
jgi:hypothetical protein